MHGGESCVDLGVGGRCPSAAITRHFIPTVWPPRPLHPDGVAWPGELNHADGLARHDGVIMRR